MSSARVRASMAAVRAGSSAAAMSRVMGLADVDLLLPAATTDKHSEQTGDEKENTVHDAERPAGLQHRASLVDRKAIAAIGHGAENAKAGCVGVVCCDRGALVAADASESVDGANEGTNEEEVNDGDKEAVGFGTVVGEEGCDGPDGTEDRDDEEHEDRVGCQGVGLHVEMHEVGEHSKGGDESDYFHKAPEGEEDSEKHGC